METPVRTTSSQEVSFFWAVPALVWQLLFFCLPLLLIIFLSFVKTTQESVWQVLTAEYYTNFFDLKYIRIVGRSLALAIFNAIFCCLFAYPVAYYLALGVRRWKNLLLFLLTLPFWTNFLVQIYAWFFVLERYGLVNSVLLKLGIVKESIHLLSTPFAVYLVMLYCYMPFMALPIYSILEKFDTRFLEASADLGARPWQTFLRVTLPLSMSGVRTGFFLVFVLSFGEFVIPALVGGGKQMYVGSLISHYFLTARDVHAGSAFTCLSGFVLIVAVVLVHWMFKTIFGQPSGTSE